MISVKKFIAIIFAVACSTFSSAQNLTNNLDSGKLKFLSCNSFKNDPEESSKELLAWAKNLFLTNAKKTSAGYDPSAPIEIKQKFVFNNACIENIKLFLGPDAMVAQGEICNKDLNTFRTAIRSIGIDLTDGSVFSEKELPKDVQDKLIASTKDDTRKLYHSYFIIDGGFELPSMKTSIIKNKYSYFCER